MSSNNIQVVTNNSDTNFESNMRAAYVREKEQVMVSNEVRVHINEIYVFYIGGDEYYSR